MSDFSVDVTELRSAATTFDQLATTSQGFETRAQGMNLSDTQFGRVPGISNRLSEAYQEHRGQCIDSLAQCTTAITSVADSLRDTAEMYEELEKAIVEAMEQISSDIEAEAN